MRDAGKGLGLLPAPDDEHLRKYPLRAAAPVGNRPVVLGIAWYENDYEPVRKGRQFYITRDRGRAVGGHAIPAPVAGTKDRAAWWAFYDQGQEGACAGFAASRERTWAERVRFDGFALYHAGRRVANIPANVEGTTLRSVFEVCQTTGPYVAGKTAPDGRYRIGEYRWTQDVDEILAVLGMPADQNYIELVNSWGKAYPHYVRMDLDELAFRLRGGGEAVVVTDIAPNPVKAGAA